MKPSELIKEKLQITLKELDDQFIVKDELYLFAEKVLMYLNTPERFKAKDLEELSKKMLRVGKE